MSALQNHRTGLSRTVGQVFRLHHFNTALPAAQETVDPPKLKKFMVLKLWQSLRVMTAPIGWPYR